MGYLTNQVLRLAGAVLFATALAVSWPAAVYAQTDVTDDEASEDVTSDTATEDETTEVESTEDATGEESTDAAPGDEADVAEEAEDKVLFGAEDEEDIAEEDAVAPTPAPAPEPAAAPTPDTTEVAALDDGDEERIVVTGSRIARSNLTSPVPVTVIDAEFIENSGSVFLGDLLATLPQFQPNFTSANSTRFIGTTGIATANLRNLGDDRTLVLVNGRRHVGGLSLSPVVDINTIPQDLIERVETLTGGASAAYGADAMAGVVNFVLKDDFEGVIARGQYNVSEEGDAQSWFTSVTVGSNFAGGRGNAVISAEYTRRERLNSSERDFSATTFRTLPNPNDNDQGQVDDGVPDEILTPNAGLNILNRNGVIFPVGPGAQSFNPDGTMRPFDFGNQAVNGFEQEGGEFLRLAGLGDLLPEQERIMATSIINYDLTDWAQLYGEAKFVLTQSQGAGSGQPSFDQVGNGELLISRDNAYLPTGLASLMDSQGLATVEMGRFNNDLGQRDERVDRTTLRTAVGVKGDVNKNLSYDVGLTWGRTTQLQRTGANRVEARFFAASDAVVDVNGEVNGNPGEIVCRVNLQAARGETPTLPDGTPAPSFALSGTQGNCVPTSVFGDGAVSEEASAFINEPTQLRDTIEQVQLMGFVSANSDGYFELPGGPVSLVVGAEYRRDSATQLGDLANNFGSTFFNAIAPSEGTIDVGEAFGELSLPVLGGLPGVEELTLNAGGRVSSYSLDEIGTVLTTSLSGAYRPTDDVTVRGSFSRAIRAPNVGDAFSSLGQNFFNVDDPCDEESINDAGPERVQNCIALAEQAGFQGFQPGVTDILDDSTRAGQSGGNPDLQEETSRNWTLGGVLTPRWVPGLILTADYYNFRIEDAIEAPDAQRILDNCVDLPSIDNEFCDLITRDSSNLEITNIQQVSVNLAAIETEGIDFEARYGFDVEEAAEFFGASNTGDLGQVAIFGTANHLIRYTNFPDQADESEEQNLEGFAGDPNAVQGLPKWRFNLTLNYMIDALTFTYRLNWVDKVNRSTFEENFEDNPDFLQPQNFRAKHYHNLQARYRVIDQIEVYAGV
ncbi:MAG: TonB-dependent receptor, partial [Myxococcota bacterium]